MGKTNNAAKKYKTRSFVCNEKCFANMNVCGTGKCRILIAPPRDDLSECPFKKLKREWTNGVYYPTLSKNEYLYRR